MGKLKFMIIKEEQFHIICDALRAWIALLTEEYQNKPSLKKAQAMDKANEVLDLFTKKPKSKVQKRVEGIA